MEIPKVKLLNSSSIVSTKTYGMLTRFSIGVPPKVLFLKTTKPAKSVQNSIQSVMMYNQNPRTSIESDL